MINLLPPKEKKNLSGNRQWKIILISGFVVSIFFTALILVLVSVNISTSSKVAAERIILEGKKQGFESADVLDLQKKVGQANQYLLKLTDFYQKNPSFADFLEKISGMLPPGIYLDNISINPAEKSANIFQVHFLGYASSVDDVIKLRDNLKNDASFSQIFFPGDTWLEKQNFIFNTTFQATIKK
jgi:Tfp pilus assembly protein PilN